MAFETFDLGRVLQTAEAIKGARQQSVTEQLRQQYLGTQMRGAEQAQDLNARAAEVQWQEGEARRVYAGAQQVLAIPEGQRKQFVEQNFPQFIPQLQQSGVDWASLDEAGVSQMAQGVAAQAAAAAGIAPGAQQSQGPANVQEWEYYNRLTPEQKQQYLEMKRSQQTFMPTIGEIPTVVRPGVAGGPTQMQPLTDIETVAGNAAAVSGSQTAAQEQARTAAIAPRMAAEQGATRAGQQVDNQRTYDTFTTAMSALEKSLGGTQTNPVTGRLPAVTSAAQTAEGAQAAMAPVLKQLFRSSGEGVFTDRDQALLMDMIPTREDLPVARAAKIKMIKDLVAAKLGTAGGGSGGDVNWDDLP